jgi:hypothetical protein
MRPVSNSQDSKVTVHIVSQGLRRNDTETAKVLHVPRHERKTVFKGRGCNDAVHDRQREPCCFAVAARWPQRSAMDSVAGRIRPANQERTWMSGQSCSAVRFWLTGSRSMPLQISPMVITLRKTRSLTGISKKCRHARIRCLAGEFGWDVGVNQVSLHNLISRPGSLSRSKSRLRPRTFPRCRCGAPNISSWRLQSGILRAGVEYAQHVG